ncbi:MAG: response regulator [Desulfamplus sp.]|nr:response regulator [Desulfamplus sp.]
MNKIKTIKILVIDDEPYIRESIKGFLEDYSYRVIDAENGQKGLEYFEQESPDLVFCDLRMPRMDGLEVLSKIVKISPDTPVIIISGVGNIADTVEALRLGAWDYIIKPLQDMTVLLHSIEKSLERAALIKEKEIYRKDLEALNARLLNSLDNLEKTKDKLVQSEKMAALGGLVAGVAHEINTPVGIAITAASFIKDKTSNVQELYTAGNLKKSDLESYLKNMGEVSNSIFINMERAASLIKSFKQIAVDQSVEDKRRFNFKRYLQDVLISLKPAYRNTGCTVKIDCADDIEILSYPGAYSQIISNLVINSVVHGFPNKKNGEISFAISMSELSNEELTIRYKDNGEGMTQDQVSKVFDPFYTTMRGQGGTGLGMSIVYNIVTQTLGGTIECRSMPGVETEFLITVPLVVPDADSAHSKAFLKINYHV